MKKPVFLIAFASLWLGAATLHSQDIVLTAPDSLLMEGGEYTPTANGGPFTAMTAGSTVTGASSAGVRKSMFSLFSTNPTDEDSSALDIQVIQRSHDTGLARTGISVTSYTEPDDGGDTSAGLFIQTGGGNALSAYKSHLLRPDPEEFTDYSSSAGGACEFGTADGQFAVNVVSGGQIGGSNSLRSVGLRARIDNSVSDGIIVEPGDGVFDTRLAFVIGQMQTNAAPVNSRGYWLLNGQIGIGPGSAMPPFVLGTNAQGQKVTGLAADLLDGAHASATPAASTIPITGGGGTIAAGFLPSPLSGISSTTGSGSVVAMQTSPAFLNTVTFTGDNPISIQRGTGSQGRASGLVMKDQAGTAVGAMGTEGAVTNNLMLMSISDIDFHTGSNLLSTGKVLTVKSNSHIVSAGTAPSVSCTGTGTSPSSPTATGTDAAFTVTMNTGTGSPGSTGTCTITFGSAYSSNPVIVCMLVKGATAWGSSATIQLTTESSSAPVLTWANPAALATSTSYKFSCHVLGV